MKLNLSWNSRSKWKFVLLMALIVVINLNVKRPAVTAQLNVATLYERKRTFIAINVLHEAVFFTICNIIDGLDWGWIGKSW